MTDRATVGEIISQYERHGWKFRRALLSDESRILLGEMLDGIEVTISDLEALWFSRKSKPETETWELRRLTGSPFALIAVVSSDASAGVFESTLAQVADEMRAKIIA
jgi:hypothetical protein